MTYNIESNPAITDPFTILRPIAFRIYCIFVVYSDVMERTDLVIVGGGITGLSAAYIASKSGKQVTVIEAGKEFGGLLNTFEIGGSRLEFYYHHFFMHDAELNWLIRELGLEDRLFFRKTSMGVFKDGKIFGFNTPLDLLKFSPINLIDKFRFGFTSLFLGKWGNWKKYEGVSCETWFDKWAGKSTTDALWKPLLKIKFGPYASKVPLAWMIGRLRQRMSSRKNGDERLGYLEGSLQVLLDTLLDKLKANGVRMMAESPVENIRFDKGKVISIMTPNQEIIGDNYLFTIPGPQLADLFKSEQPELSKRIGQIRYFGAVCVILDMKKPLSDIYWLNIADQGFPFGGVIEQTNFISPDNYNGKHLAYLSRYFAHEEEIAGMTNEEIKEMMIEKLPAIYSNFSFNDLTDIYVFRTQTAATVCDLNFSTKVFKCQTEVSNLYIANMSHVYPDERSTNNSIRVAAAACSTMGIDSSFVPSNASLSAQIGF